MIWAGIGHTRSTCLVSIGGNLIIDRHIYEILRRLVYAVFEARQPSSSKKKNATSYVERCVLTFLNLQGIRLLPGPARSPDQNPLKTSGYGLLRHCPATPPHLLRLMNYGYYWKQHGMSWKFLLFKTSSTPSLTA